MLDNDTVLVRQELKQSSEKVEMYKTLLHSMRNVAKKNYTVKETKEHRRPRIQYCGYKPHGNDNNPIKLCSSEKGNLFFSGLANCGGYWRCPVCALKIANNKQELLSALITSHQKEGKTIGFLTLTVRHSAKDPLIKTLDKLLSNFKAFQNTRWYQDNKKEIELFGMVKTLEITYSFLNGWHPHLHVLFFYDNSKGASSIEFQKRFISRWSKFRDNNGLVSAQNQKILTTDISDYLAKYDITHEMTKGNIKGSKGLTPFTCLAKIALGDYEDYQQKRLLYWVYATYVEYTQGRHYVNISRSLLKKYAEQIEEFNKTDQEIVDETNIDEILLKISLPVWRKIALNDLQPLVLNKYKENGLNSVYNLLTYFNDFKDLQIEIDKHNIPLLI
ncbi:protein rep [Flavobacterium crassostreae]|uniref:protein rep n=1 Tax=Flavobacterium crassostreae TaxID=1763534 RepID=UPI0012FD2C80|nr:protein rep [Flavobacterium crassostreae]